MTTDVSTCPHCGSHDNRLLSDQSGSVGWCRACHRAWIPSPVWEPARNAGHRPPKCPPQRERSRRIA